MFDWLFTLLFGKRYTHKGSAAKRAKECSRHPVPGRPCQPPGPHSVARGAKGCTWCGREITDGE